MALLTMADQPQAPLLTMALLTMADQPRAPLLTTALLTTYYGTTYYLL